MPFLTASQSNSLSNEYWQLMAFNSTGRLVIFFLTLEKAFSVLSIWRKKWSFLTLWRSDQVSNVFYAFLIDILLIASISSSVRTLACWLRIGAQCCLLAKGCCSLQLLYVFGMICTQHQPVLIKALFFVNNRLWLTGVKHSTLTKSTQIAD